MKRFIVYMLLAVCSVAAFAQGQVKGTVLDKNSDEPLSFVGLKVTPQGKTTFIKGANSDLDGNFTITGLSNGKYTLTISYVGYKTATRNFEITDKNHSVRFPFIHLSEDSKMLKEVTVTGQKSNMKLEVDRKSFDVAMLSIVRVFLLLRFLRMFLLSRWTMMAMYHFAVTRVWRSGSMVRQVV